MDPSGLVIKISAETAKTKLWRSRLGFPTSEEQLEDEQTNKKNRVVTCFKISRYHFNNQTLL